MRRSSTTHRCARRPRGGEERAGRSVRPRATEAYAVVRRRETRGRTTTSCDAHRRRTAAPGGRAAARSEQDEASDRGRLRRTQLYAAGRPEGGQRRHATLIAAAPLRQAAARRRGASRTRRPTEGDRGVRGCTPQGDPREDNDVMRRSSTTRYLILAIRWLISDAWQAAPYPLSMLTTDTPGAHELSIARSAVSPPNDVP